MPVKEGEKEDPRVKVLLQMNPWMDFMMAETFIKLSDRGELEKFNQMPLQEDKPVPTGPDRVQAIYTDAITIEEPN